MDEATRECLRALMVQLDSLAVKLAANVPPGHVAYISKADASRWAQCLAKRAREEWERGR